MAFRSSPRVKRPTLMLLTLLLSIGGVTSPLSSQDPDPRIRAVEEGIMGTLQVQGRENERFSILDRMAHYNVPGISVAVLDGGKIVWAKGYGVADADTGEPITPQTLFQAASISKPVAAMAALRLVDEGVLDLDAPANQYLESWKIPDNEFTRDAPVTLRHLLTHTGGLTVHGFPGYSVTDDVATTIQVLDGSGPANTGEIRVDTPPGNLWRYSGGGYTILQQLLADVTGNSFPQLMRELVLDPAGMSTSSYQQPLPPGRAVSASTAHLGDGTAVDGHWHIYPEMAAAGLWTTPTELARLAINIQESAHNHPNRILSQGMTEAQLTTEMGGWGLGFQVSGEGNEARFSHGGANHGFRAQYMAYRDGGRGVFVMTNGDQGSPLTAEISLAVAREYGWPFPQHRKVILADVAPQILEEIAGVYLVEEQGLSITVRVTGDHLTADVAGLQELILFPTATNFFIDLTDGSRTRVDRDESGEVSGLQIIGGPSAIRVREEQPADRRREATQEPLVVFLVRHAEKTEASADPELSASGQRRAELLATVLRNTELDHIHSTDYIRTRNTAAPTAASFGLEVELYDPRNLGALVQKLRDTGGRHLVVGHSNTTPTAVDLLGGESGSEIEEGAEYDRLYIITISAAEEVSTVLLRYGEFFEGSGGSALD